MKHGPEKLLGMNVAGMILIHTFFGSEQPFGNEVNESEEARKRFTAFCHFVYPTTSGCDDPLLNPIFYPKMASLEGRGGVKGGKHGPEPSQDFSFYIYN
jgi:hypothetical protein